LESEPSVFVRKIEDTIVVIAVYIDDLQITSNDLQTIEDTKLELHKRFQMTDLGEVNHILGLRVLRTDEQISIDQKHYVENILMKFGMDQCYPVSTPMETSLKLLPLQEDEDIIDLAEYRSVVRALNYLATVTRPDIAFATSMVARHVQKPGLTHWQAVK
jgi:hypothetical protein